VNQRYPVEGEKRGWEKGNPPRRTGKVGKKEPLGTQPLPLTQIQFRKHALLRNPNPYRVDRDLPLLPINGAPAGNFCWNEPKPQGLKIGVGIPNETRNRKTEFRKSAEIS